MAKGKKKAVAYIVKKFPVLSETFILYEILELEAQGIPVHIFSLERPNDPTFHEDLPKLKAHISYIPDFSDMNSLWKHSARASNHYGKSYKNALAYALKHMKPSLVWRFFQSCYVANQAKRFGVRHFHAHFATRPTSVAFFASMITSLPYSFTAHAMDIFKHRLSTRSLRKKIRLANFVVTISDYNKKHLSQIVDGDSRKIVRIYNGIDVEKFRTNSVAKKSPFKFLCVARLVEKKGHRFLIEACDMLRKRGVKFECWLVGKGGLRSSISELIKQKKLSDCVKLLGPYPQSGVVSFYKKAHAYVLPCIIASDGNREGLPVSVVEALGSGLPVITTCMTGITEVIEPNHNGLLVPFKDAKALASAMERLIEDNDLYNHLKSNTRKVVESRFDIRETSKVLYNLFKGSLS